MITTTNPLRGSLVFARSALLALIACSAATQAQSEPGFSRKPQPSWIVINSFTSVPGDDIRSVMMMRAPSDAAGTWTTCLTAAKLPAFFGGDDKSLGVVLGIFDPGAASFRVGQLAAALNSSEDDRHLSLHPSGLWAVLERPSGLYLGQRSSTNAAFGAAQRILGLPSLSEAHPHLGRLGGADQLFFVQNGELRRQPIDLAQAKVTGSASVVARPLQSGARLVSGAPIHGPDGDAEALFLSETPGPGDCDLLWDDDLDPATPPRMFMQGTDWTNDPTVAGGYLYWAHDILPRWHLMHSEAAWALGDVEAPGGTIDLGFGCVPGSLPLPSVTVVLYAATTMSSVAVPGFGGRFGLDAVSLATLGLATHGSADGLASLQLGVPNDPSLSGLRLAVQGLNVDGNLSTLTLTNTAWIRIR